MGVSGVSFRPATVRTPSQISRPALTLCRQRRPNWRRNRCLRVAIRPGAAQALNTLNLQLKIVSALQQLNVPSDTGPAVSTEAAGNTNALVLRGDDLNALADDTEDLQADLQALAGPAAGPGGGAIFIDGFSGGELPQKESIREIRINQDPFAP